MARKTSGTTPKPPGTTGGIKPTELDTDNAEIAGLSGVLAEVPLNQVKTHPKNRRRGNVDLIAKSILQHGQYKPILVQKSTTHILAGNHTYQALKMLGRPSVVTYTIDVDDDKAYEILLADNYASDSATYDKKGLVADLEEFYARVGNLVGTLWDETALQKLKGGLPEVSDGSLLALTKVTLGESETKTQHGDVWFLGKKQILIVADVLSEHHLWKSYLDAGDLFVPYPGVYAAVSVAATRVSKVVMVQPNDFIASHIIDRFKEASPTEEVKRK